MYCNIIYFCMHLCIIYIIYIVKYNVIEKRNWECSIGQEKTQLSSMHLYLPVSALSAIAILPYPSFRCYCHSTILRCTLHEPFIYF